MSTCFGPGTQAAERSIARAGDLKCQLASFQLLEEKLETGDWKLEPNDCLETYLRRNLQLPRQTVLRGDGAERGAGRGRVRILQVGPVQRVIRLDT